MQIKLFCLEIIIERSRQPVFVVFVHMPMVKGKYGNIKSSIHMPWLLTILSDKNIFVFSGRVV